MNDRFRSLIGVQLTTVVLGVGSLMWGLAGPVPRFELVRLTRRGRVHLLRVVFLAFLLVFLGLSYRANDLGRLGTRRTLADAVRDLTQFAETFFFAFLCVQFVLVLILTPIWLGGAVAEDRDRRRLVFLFGTGLNDGEIILGKLTAGLGRLMLVVVAGLPVLAFMQFWGGIDPNLVIAGYGITAVTMLSVGALTVLCSVHARQPRDATIMTFLVLIAFAVITLFCRFLMRESVLGLSWPAWIADGNILVVLYQVREGWRGGIAPERILPTLLLHYGVFHGVVTPVCVSVAVLQLRRAPSLQSGPIPRHNRAWLRLRRPAPGSWPMLWKETFAERGLSLGRIGWLCVILIAAATLVPVLGRHFLSQRPRLRVDVVAAFDVWGRLIVTGGACLALLGVAIHAAGAISRERERHTLDSLLGTSLTRGEILFGKWIGSILSMRGVGIGLLVIWAITTGMHGMRGLAFLAGLIVWLIYAGCFAMLGLWFSVTRRNTTQATVWTMVAVMTLSLGHWLPMFFVRPTAPLRLPQTITFIGLTPLASLHWIALNGDTLVTPRQPPSYLFERFRKGSYSLRERMTRPSGTFDGQDRSKQETADVLVGLGIGLAFWVMLTAVLWQMTLKRFVRTAPA